MRRVRPEVERLVAHLLPHVLREQRLAVGRIDLPAIDAELRNALDRVVLLRLQAARRPRLPVRGGDDQ